MAGQKKNIAAALTLGGILWLGQSVCAQAQILGVSSRQIRASYAGLQAVRTSDGHQALELKDLDYAGVRWQKVDFIFDEADHLQALAFHAQTAKYEKVLALAQMEPPAQEGPVSAAGPSDDADMQIRVCEAEDGGVTLTYEAATSTT